MPRKRRHVCSRQKSGDPLHKAPFSRDLGLCGRCSSKAKAGTRRQKQEAGRLSSGNKQRGKCKRDAGSAGGSACGDAKRRCGVTNGSCTLELDRHVTWKATPVTFEVFLKLLARLHERRLASAPRPWLSPKDLPADADIPADVVQHVIEVMTGSKFGHPDRYEDRVSKEILSSMRRASTIERSVATLIVLFSENTFLVKAFWC